MKKVIILLAFLISFTFSFGQAVTPRGSSTITVSDARLQALYNLYIPRYIDTLDANAHIGIDSCGAIIFTYSGNSFWQRQCNPKKWVFVGGVNIFNSTSVINIISTTISTTTFSICNGNNVCDTLTVNTTVQNISTAGFINDSTIVLCDTIQNCDTVHIPQQQVFAAQNGAKYVSPGVLEWGTNPLLHATTIPMNGVDLTFTQTQTGGFNITQTHSGSNAGLQLNNPGSIGLGLSGNGVINSSNTDISFTGYTGLINAVFKFNGGIQFPQFPNTLASSGVATKFFAPDASGNVGLYSIVPPEQCGLQSGDIVTFDSTHNGQGYYDVSNGSYCINQNDYSNPVTLVILPKGDATLPRIDDFIGDTLSVASAINGTPAANPIAPQPNPSSQILFTTVTINPLDSIPSGLILQSIYDQNLGTAGGEFAPTATGVSVNFANTVNPLHLTIAADVGSFATGNHIDFTNNAQLTFSNYLAFKFYIRLKSTWTNGVRMSFQWMLAGVPVSTNSVTIGGNASPFNFVRTTVGGYQVITIPASAWARRGNIFDGLRITFTGTNAQGIYLDWIQFQGGIQQGTGGGNTGTVTSVAVTGNSLLSPVVTNPNTNVNIALNYAPICAGCFPGNQTGGVAVPTLGPINLSNNGNFTGTLPPVLITPGAEGSILQIVSGVPTFTLLPLGYDTTFVGNGLNVIPGVSNDTLLWGGQLRQLTTIDLNGNTVTFSDGATGSLFYVDPIGFGAILETGNGVGESDVTLTSDVSGNNVKWRIYSNDGSNPDSYIEGDGGTSQDIEYKSAKHLFIGGLLKFTAGANDLLVIDSVGFNSFMAANDGTAQSRFSLDANSAGNDALFDMFSTNGSGGVEIQGNGVDKTITLTAANGVAIADYIAGASTDSVVTWDAATQVLKMRNASSLGTTPNLQAVTDVGAITTHTVVSRINFESQPSYESDFVSALSFTGNGINAEGALILREWSTGGGDLLTLSPVTALSGNITLRLPNGNDGDTLATQAYARSIVGTTLQAKADLTAQTTAVSSVATFTPSANGTFRIGGYINITAVTAGIVTLKVTYTDENSQSVTQIIPLTIASTGAVGTTATVLNSNNSATDILIRAKSGGAITVLTTLANVATYDVGARIEQL